MPLKLFALCSSVEQQKHWQSRTAQFPDLSVEVVFPVRSAVDLVYQWISIEDEPFLVCQEDVRFGLPLAAVVRALIGELTELHPRWGICSSRGARWNCSVPEFGREVNTPGIHTAVGPEPVLVAGDGLLLVNPAVLRSRPRYLPQFLPGTSCALALSLDCLRNHVPVLVDPRLFALRLHRISRDSQQQLIESNAFRTYYSGAFVNHKLASAEGYIDLKDEFDFHGALDPRVAGGRSDLLSLYEQSLLANRSRPPLTLCSRTQFRRPELLQHTIATYAAARVETGAIADVRTVLITDETQAVAAPQVAALREQYPAADLECWHHIVRQPRFSRVDLMIAAIERAQTDYIWLVDDDDFVIPSGCRAAARDLLPGRARLLIGDAFTVREQWANPTPTRPCRILEDARRESHYGSSGVLTALSGQNQTPLCSMIIPVQLAQERLRNRHAWGDFNEDYFLLLLLLTAPRIELTRLDVEVAGISLRGIENTVAQTDMEQWHLSYCTVMLEIMNNPGGNSPALWQLANRTAAE